MDSIDYRIVEILLKDGRISMKELAKMVALSAPSVAERVRRLEESNIITGYKAMINYEKIGKIINVLINVDMNVQKSKKFMEFIKTEDSIIECNHVTGPYCKILKARLEDMESLEKIIEKIQVFGNTETYIILSSVVKDIKLENNK